MKPGIYPNLPNEQYHESIGLSSSGIKEILRSPLHFLQYRNEGSVSTRSMDKGSLIHCLSLEPDKFHELYATGDFKIRRGKEYEKVVEENPGKIVLPKKEYDDACKIVEALHFQKMQNSELRSLLEGGFSEHSFYWEDASGVLCKVRPDRITSDGQTIVDLKTARDASFDGFQKAVVDYGYHISAAYYLRGVSETIHFCIKNNRPLPFAGIPKRFVHLVIETEAPYAVALYELDDVALRIAREQIDKALSIYCDATVSNEWKGYSPSIQPISLPNWAMYKFNKAE